MKKFYALALAIILVSTFAVGTALADGRTISVTGTATIRVAPTIVNVYLGVTQTESTIQAAQDKTNKAIQKVVKALTKAGVAEEDIVTSSYTVYAEYNYNYQDGSQSFKGFTANCQITVIVREVDKAGALIDAAFAAGANQLNNFEFSILDTAASQAKALQLAVQDASSKAAILADAAGVKLGAIQSVTETGSGLNVYANGGISDTLKAEGDAGSGTQLQPGMLNVVSNVTLVYEITG